MANNTRIRYCAVNSCINFRGTVDRNVHMFKIPRDRVTALQWLSFLGIESYSNVVGFVCNGHFKDEDMNKNKSRLLANAAPTLFISSSSTNVLSVQSNNSSHLPVIHTESIDEERTQISDLTTQMGELRTENRENPYLFVYLFVFFLGRS